MNTNSLAQNFFVEGDTNASRKAIFVVALKFAQKSQKVLYIARRPLERLPIDDDDPNVSLTTANILRHIIFRYANTVEELRKVVLELHTWALFPRLLIVDSMQEFFVDAIVANNDCAGSTPRDYIQFCHSHCMITAATQNAVDSMSSRVPRKPCASIISIDFEAVPSLRGYYERFCTKYYKLYYVDAASRYHASDSSLNALQQKVLETLDLQQ